MTKIDWCAPIDGYCERVGPGFWAEPVNALSNAAFLVAAASALVLWRRAGGTDRPALALIAVVAVVGLGSFLFHTFANKWSLFADVLPIMVFVYGYFALALRRYFHLGAVRAALVVGAFMAFNVAFVRIWKAVLGAGGADLTNGSVGYFPPALAMLGVGGVLVLRGLSAVESPARETLAAEEGAGRALLLAAAFFAVSLLFRSVDHAVCSWWPLGTHFAWHALNALVLFILVRTAILFRARLASDVAREGRLALG